MGRKFTFVTCMKCGKRQATGFVDGKQVCNWCAGASRR